MTTDTDKIEELAKWHKDHANCESTNAQYRWHLEQVDYLRSLSAELTELRQANINLRAQRDAATERWAATEGEVIELRQAKESLDWLFDREGVSIQHIISQWYERDIPPYLKSRLEAK